MTQHPNAGGKYPPLSYEETLAKLRDRLSRSRTIKPGTGQIVNNKIAERQIGE